MMRFLNHKGFKIGMLLLTFAFAKPLKAQESQILGFDDFMEIVITQHPLSRQAQLQPEMGRAYVMKARGNFDPKVDVNLNQKYFDGKNYYSKWDNTLKVPTWFGVDFKGGYEQNTGRYLNPESNVPAAGLFYAGVSIPVGEGLFIDQRRADVKIAKLYAESSEAERQIMLNNLLLDAGLAYWEWFYAYHQMLVYEEAEQLALTRFNAVKQEFTAGDKPAIDTVEAGIQWQNRTLSLQQSRMELQNAAAQLAVFLWQEGYVPMELAEGTRPSEFESIDLSRFTELAANEVDSLVATHPMLQQSQLKIEQLSVERKLRLEQLKPTLNVNYNALSEPVGSDLLAQYSINNYKWGLEFSMPLPMRKERAELKLNNLKLQEADLELDFKRENLVYKATASKNQWQTSAQQYQLYRNTALDYERLLLGEREKFSIGESSLFLVNSRELGYINAQLKLIELMAKNQQSQLKYLHSINGLIVKK